MYNMIQIQKQNTSEYENYSKTSKTYDQYRNPIGLPFFRKAFSDVAKCMNKSIKDLHLLDIGCGTGMYLKSFQKEINNITGLEFNKSMLNKAKSNLSNVDILEGTILNIPFADASFDVITTTQVLHHIETGEDNNFSNILLASKEIFRCLRPGGCWVVQTQTPLQHINGFWWSPIIPNAAYKLSKRFPTKEKFKLICKNVGFKKFESDIPSETLVKINKYLDIEGPFNENFRNSDSTWSLAEEDELNNGLIMFRSIINTGLIKQWLQKREELRTKYGQTITFIVTKC